MIIVFYFLWILSVSKVLISPAARVFSKTFFFALIPVGIWILLGAFSYQTQYAQFLKSRTSFLVKKEAFEEVLKRVKTIHDEHPTSRDALLQLAIISHQIGDSEHVSEYESQLKLIDPNHPAVVEFFLKTH